MALAKTAVCWSQLGLITDRSNLASSTAVSSSTVATISAQCGKSGSAAQKSVDTAFRFPGFDGLRGDVRLRQSRFIRVRQRAPRQRQWNLAAAALKTGTFLGVKHEVPSSVQFLERISPRHQILKLGVGCRSKQLHVLNAGRSTRGHHS